MGYSEQSDYKRCFTFLSICSRIYNISPLKLDECVWIGSLVTIAISARYCLCVYVCVRRAHDIPTRISALFFRNETRIIFVTDFSNRRKQTIICYSRFLWKIDDSLETFSMWHLFSNDLKILRIALSRKHGVFSIICRYRYRVTTMVWEIVTSRSFRATYREIRESE